MRVALLTNFIPPYRVRLYEALAKEAGELRVFVSTRMESNRQWQPDFGSLDVVEQRTLTMRGTWQTQTFSEPYELHVPYDTVTQLRKWRPDVILSGEFGARSLLAMAYARATRTPIALWAMLSEHTENGRGSVRNLARRWLVRNAGTIIVNGASGARYFQRFGVNDDRLLRVHQSLDMNAFLALPLERPAHDEFYLLHVGSLSERKGVRLLLEALTQWTAANPTRRVRLTLVGDGPLAEELKESPGPPGPHFVGSVPYGELPQWYGRADALMFPSLGDEWGLVVNEALAAGVPVMGSAFAQAVDELIEDGVNGWVFRPDDVAAVTKALDRVLKTHRNELTRMQRAARESVIHLTPEAAAKRMADRLRTLVNPMLPCSHAPMLP
ncbi:MAG: glycosyltransferase family 4 protein [Gemmatimonadota bacterium]